MLDTSLVLTDEQVDLAYPVEYPTGLEEPTQYICGTCCAADRIDPFAMPVPLYTYSGLLDHQAGVHLLPVQDGGAR